MFPDADNNITDGTYKLLTRSYIEFFKGYFGMERLTVNHTCKGTSFIIKLMLIEFLSTVLGILLINEWPYNHIHKWIFSDSNQIFKNVYQILITF